MSLLDKLPHTIALTHRTYSTDSAGGDVPAYGDPYEAAWPCWVQQAGGSGNTNYKYRDMSISHMIYITSNPGLQLDDRVLYGSVQLKLKAFPECTAGANRAIVMMCDLDSE